MPHNPAAVQFWVVSTYPDLPPPAPKPVPDFTYAARLWQTLDYSQPTSTVLYSTSLDELRERLPFGWFPRSRNYRDPRSTIETWHAPAEPIAPSDSSAVPGPTASAAAAEQPMRDYRAREALDNALRAAGLAHDLLTLLSHENPPTRIRTRNAIARAIRALERLDPDYESEDDHHQCEDDDD